MSFNRQTFFDKYYRISVDFLRANDYDYTKFRLDCYNFWAVHNNWP